MILKDLLKQPLDTVLIEDSLPHRGRPLLYSILRQYCDSGFIVHYLKYDSLLTTEESDMKQLNFVPLFKSAAENLHLTSEGVKLKGSQLDKVILAIDSLSPLLVNWTVGQILTFIKGCIHSNQFSSVVALVHGDVHEAKTLQGLRHSFTCHLTLKLIGGHKVCQGSWRKSSGKIVDSDERYSVSSNYILNDIGEANIHGSASSSIASIPRVTLTPSSTFKLSLNPNEKVARSQVILPYVKQQGSFGKEGPPTGQIIYEAENDDWDDEDPDDDLEI